VSAWVPPGTGQEVELDADRHTMKLAEAAVLIGVPPAKLGTWRTRGVGPSFARTGEHRTSSILYDPAEIQAVRQDRARHLAAESKSTVDTRINRTRKPRRKRQTRKR
jgi:hypothetical protein